MFTQNHEWLIVVYLQLLPPFDCDKWKNIKALTDEQRDFIDEFIAEFSKTIEMDNYHPDEKGAK
ncbi:MAG: hypothetical protein GY859_32905 [Desulfobacterales bacterium]|nr:hypothetical protein [Desulfobacterales bacterium]